MRFRAAGPLRTLTTALAMQVLPEGGGNGLAIAPSAFARAGVSAGRLIAPTVSMAKATQMKTM